MLLHVTRWFAKRAKTRLTAGFRLLLPLSFISSAVPVLNSIYEYKFQISTNSVWAPSNRLVLLFWDDNLLSVARASGGYAGLLMSLWPMLDPTWEGEKESWDLQKGGNIVQTSSTFDLYTKVARVWMPSEMVDMMVTKGWKCGGLEDG
jgi:hypothetical protein